jgi:hypothetical protein
MEETSFWDRLRDSVSRGLKVAADRTDEIARIGKLKLDLVNLKRKMVYELGELGKQLLVHLDEVGPKGNPGTIKDFMSQDLPKQQLENIDSIRSDIEAVEKKIKELSGSEHIKPAEETEKEKQSSQGKSPPTSGTNKETP